jgi:collagenase-like PrtC family protease
MAGGNMKVLVNINHIDDINNSSDAYLAGIRDFSVNMPSFDIDNIKKIIDSCNNKHKDIFIGINKNIHEEELNSLKNILLELDKYQVTGIIFYDMALLQLKKELKLHNNLVWGQEHMTTNSSTINFFYQKGVKYTLLSSELSYDELNEIVNESKSKLIIPLFGYQSMMVSRRKLINNYLSTFNIRNNDQLRYMSKEGKRYALEENNGGTIVYSSYILNGLKEALKITKKDNYIYLNSFNIPGNIFKEVIDIYKDTNESNVDINEEKINKLLEGKTDKGFLYHETVYKVR